MYFILEAAILVARLINRFVRSPPTATLLTEITLKVLNFFVVLFMFLIFVKLVKFFKEMKEAKLTRMEKYKISCRH
jgi:hypothetical protein